MARDLAEELARRETELATRTAPNPPASNSDGTSGPNGRGKRKPDGPGSGEKPDQGKEGQGRDAQEKADGPGQEAKDGQNGPGNDGKEGQEGPGKEGQAKDGKGGMEGPGNDGQGQGDKEGQGQAKDGQNGQVPGGQGQGEKDGQGQAGSGDKEGAGKDGSGAKGEGEKGQGAGDQPGTQPGQGGRGGAGGWANLTEAEQIDRMAEMARTLEAWLKQIDKRGEAKSAEAVREILEAGNVAEIVERTDRMGEIRVGGKRPELNREATELATKLEAISQTLGLLHQGIVAPELAALDELDRRMAALIAKLDTMKTEAEVAAWNGEVAALVRDLEKANIVGAAELAAGLQANGGWHWDVNIRRVVGPDRVATAFRGVAVQIKDRMQEMILKDLAVARDEATPPMFRELVERYYEVISRGAPAK